MSIADNIDDFLTLGPNNDGSYTVTRTATGTTTNARYSPGATSTLAILASVQPTGGRDLKALAEAQITTESRAVLTKTEILDHTDANQADTIAIEADGVPWTVVEVMDCPDGEGGVYYRALVARKSMR